MSIHELIENGANVTIAVGVADLKEFALSLIEQTKREAAREYAQNPDDVFYTTEQVMSMLNVDRSTLWRWKQDTKNYLVPIKIGGLDRYRKSDIDRILKPKI